MTIITLENVVKNFTERNILDHVSLSINEGEKIGIVGVNGTGKSTLLKIIAGSEHINEGEIKQFGQFEIRFLSQTSEIDSDATVLEQVFSSNAHGIPILKEYESILKRIENGEYELTDQLLKLQEKMDENHLWDLESQVKTILNKLGITDYNELVKNLSGGERKRVFLAQSLVTPCDLLILDEPTNHLDSETITWLESFLNSFKKSLLMVTHDRYFLDKVTNKIIEIDNGKLYEYDGNYSTYIENRIERERITEEKVKKQHNLYRNELKWIKRGALARSTKQKARIQRFEDLKKDMVNETKEQLEFSMIGKRLGKKLIEFQNVSKGFDSLNLINDFSYTMLKTDRIGIVGPNGCGKSTLLKMIVGELEPDQGAIELGSTISIGYFNQQTDILDPSMKMIDYLKEEAEVIKLSNGEVLTAGKVLEKFLFDKSTHYTPIEKLSGGEKRRLMLLRMLMSSPNVILLDEPTNDFDTMTLQVLEDFIDRFNGIVITVSHDRYFLNRICNKIFAYDGTGKIHILHGNYDDYLDLKDSFVVKEEKKTIVKAQEKSPRAVKLSYMEQREFDTIEEDIEALEIKIETLDGQITEFYSDYFKTKPLIAEKETLEQELENKMDRWEYLTEKQMAFEQAKNEKNS